MKLILLITFFVFYAFSNAQEIKTMPYLAGLMSDVGYEYKVIHDSLNQVPFEGDTLKKFDVNVFHFQDMLIIYVNLSKAAMAQQTPVVLDKAILEKLMWYNMHYDYLKFGVEQSNGELFVRIDVYTIGLNARTLRKFIDQVGRAANEIYPELMKKKG